MKSIPHVISWNLTKACNLLCTHCYLPTNSFQQFNPTNHSIIKSGQPQFTTQDTKDELDTNNALKVIDEIAELNPNIILILTGGEPLLRRDLFDLSRYASRKG
ncbi:MAG: radical SAM protein, partial [Planctomycetota bacterium]